MQQLIIIKYAELNTKKANIGLFLKTLKENIQSRLKKQNVEIVFDKGRMYIKNLDQNVREVFDLVTHTFGIHEVALGYELENTKFETVCDALFTLVQDKTFKTFKVETKRSDKTYPYTSLEISKKLGGLILKHKEGVLVDVHQPEVCIEVEIRKTNAYLYFETEQGLGGYPVGTLGKGLLMLSGGIDSPVAGFLAMKRGVKLEAIYFDSPPHTSIEARNKVIILAKKLSEYQGNLKLHIIPFTKIQETIYQKVPKEYLITIMRRMMYRISEMIAQKNHCKILINGESIGQVASQTLDSMRVINEVVTIPVIRPVACFDKLEIIQLSKKIETYDTSILPYQDCCTIFVPEHPVIYPKADLCHEYEQAFDFLPLLREAVSNETIIRTNEEENEFQDYL